MELHSADGTHKLELPVSRTTLKDCGGVPTEISEKSNHGVSLFGYDELANGWNGCVYIAHSKSY